MLRQNLASLPTHLQDGVHSCDSYLFHHVLPLVKLALSNPPWRLHQQQLCPSGKAVEEGSRTGEGPRGYAEWEERKEQGCDHERAAAICADGQCRSHECRLIVVATAVSQGFSAHCEKRQDSWLMLGIKRRPAERQTDRARVTDIPLTISHILIQGNPSIYLSPHLALSPLDKTVDCFPRYTRIFSQTSTVVLRYCVVEYLACTITLMPLMQLTLTFLSRQRSSSYPYTQQHWI